MILEFRLGFVIDREARETMHLVASVRQFVCALTAEPFDLRPSRLCRVQPRAIRAHYQSKVFVSVCNYLAYADNHEDAVDRLLISGGICYINRALSNRNLQTILGRKQPMES